MIAFIVNVGLFVKAKINLQNAVDAAAWSGASTQARQLTNIAHLNWELRNTYKEYLFKYYVLGQLGLDTELKDTSKNKNFRMRPFFDSTSTSGAANLGSEKIDPYNVPSVCIHFGSPHNICAIYDIPGLPRFNTVGMPSISPYHESFLNSIAKTKAENCSRRSDINFGVGMTWAYGTGSKTLFKDMPQIAASRVGAFPQSLEIALRIRNLEYLVNRPPVQGPICFSSSRTSCSQTVDGSLASQSFDHYPWNERPIKAFMTAYKNLGGGDFKESPEDQNFFSSTFRLTELPPTVFSVGANTLSSFLIPSNRPQALEKHYLDLMVWPVNMLTFFTTFVSENPNDSSISGVPAEASCKGSRTGLPIPAYITGFTKNPNMVTYYAVKGEAEFVGLLYPFSDSNGITLSTYAAAKPFGGRIGPLLFETEGSGTSGVVKVRSDSIGGKSTPYVSTIVTDGVFKPGKLIPVAEDFYVEPGSTQPIGGVPNASNPRYVIPNIFYEFAQGYQSPGGGGAKIQILEDALNDRATYDSPKQKLGLYHPQMFEKFYENLPNPSSVVFTDEEVTRALENVRAPTVYETLNYLIPTVSGPGTSGEAEQRNIAQPFTGLFESISPDTGNPAYSLYAPLFGQGMLYESSSQVEVMLSDYINANRSSIETYLDSLKSVAEDMVQSAEASRGGRATYEAAANTIHPRTPSLDMPANCANISMATKFSHFFFADGEQCEIRPLKTLMKEYMDQIRTGSTPNGSTNFRYANSFVLNPPLNNKALMSGYIPGAEYSVSPEGEQQSIFSGSGGNGISSARNSYSTKLVSIDSLRKDVQESYYTSSKAVLSEGGNLSQVIKGAEQSGFLNSIDTSQIREFQLSSGEFSY